MTSDDAVPADGSDAGDPIAVVPTGRRGQQLICEGWFASHGDSGTPGPHIHLRTSDRQALVIRTDQVPSIIEALSSVAHRIDRAWELDGDQYAHEVVLRSPDPQDPEVVRRRQVEHLTFTQLFADNLPAVTRLLTQAESTDEALGDIAELLGVEEGEVMYRLARFDLLSLTRPAHERRQKLLNEPES